MSNHHRLQWTARLDRRLISTRGGKRHILVDVTAPRRQRDPDDERPPLNLGLVIDASGSMAGEPLDAAVAAARGVVELLRPSDRITVVSFADDVRIHADGVPADAEGRRRVNGALDRLHTRGCTNLGAGWLEGCERVAAGMVDGASAQHRVVLLSDGHANRGLVDPEQLGYHAAELRRRGLYTSCVGVGDHYSPLQLQAIAEHGGGRLHDAPVGEDIVAVVLGELGEILATAADDLELTVDHPRRMPVTVLGPYARQADDGRLVVNLGSLVAGASRQVVLQVAVPAGRVGERHDLELLPAWRTPDDGREVGAPPLGVGFSLAPAVEVAAELPDLDTCLLVARLWQKHLLLEATLLNTEGRYDEAAGLIREALPGFKDYCRGLRGARRLVRELERHGGRVGLRMEESASKACFMEASLRLKGDFDHRINRRELDL